jgi:uncharacterized protein YjbI with pentapeptide repeats
VELSAIKRALIILADTVAHPFTSSVITKGDNVVGLSPGAAADGADLSGIVLSGVDLKGIRLRNANLSGAILTNVDLSQADLTGADLSGARLSEVKLDGAKLDNVNRKDAVLSGDVQSALNGGGCITEGGGTPP